MKTEKLYSPLTFYIHNPREEEASGEYGMYGLYDERYKISHHEVADQYADAIELAMRRDRDGMNKVRGLAEHLPEELQDKVHSLFPSVEQHGAELYCAAMLELTETLTPYETAVLKNWWRGQLSDGWGEGFEQREISVGFQGNELYVVPWTSDESLFFLDTAIEFAKRIGVDPVALGVTVQSASPLSPAQKALYEPDMFDSEEVAALRELLIERLGNNLSDYFEVLRDMNGKEITGMSHEIAAVAEAHFYLTEKHNFHTSELEYLLQFKNPLKVVADLFEHGIVDNNRSDIMWVIFDKQDALQGDYELVSTLSSDDPASSPTMVTTQDKTNKAVGLDEKLSVIDEIRQAMKEARDNPATPKDATTRKKSHPEL